MSNVLICESVSRTNLKHDCPNKSNQALNELNRQAQMLQEFAAQSKRKLSKAKALEQASQLKGYKDYQTALAAISTQEAKKQESKNDFSETKEYRMTPWETDAGYTAGKCSAKQDNQYFSVKLTRDDQPESAIEVVLELDRNMPRVLVYTPEACDEPIFSVHSDKPGLVLQYMADDDQMFHKNKADEAGTEMIGKVAHCSKGVWFVPNYV